MEPIILEPGAVHDVPEDLAQAIYATEGGAEAWNALTLLGRNEWICWTISVKKAETRQEHIDRLCRDITNGKRRPCCWPGCKHRDRSK